VQMAPVLTINWIDMSVAMPSVGLIGPCRACAAMMLPPVRTWVHLHFVLLLRDGILVVSYTDPE
jgi:hypothetical protein